MNNAIYNFPAPQNEPVLNYFKNSPERIALDAERVRQTGTTIEIPLIIGGKEIRTGDIGEVRAPHNTSLLLATYHKVWQKEIGSAIEAALNARKMWANLTWTIRASILLKAMMAVP